MKFQVTQKNLNNCLKDVAIFADKGQQLDLTKNIALKTSANMLEVSATNLETSIIAKLSGSCKQAGSITIPASIFKDYIQNLPLNENSKKVSKIELEVKEKKKLKIVYDQTHAQINGLPLKEDQHPIIKLDKKQKPILQIKADDLRADLNKVVFAANKDISRPLLTSVFLHVFEKDFYLTATDSYRLAERKISKHSTSLSPAKKTVEVLLPALNCLKIERVLSGHADKMVNLYKDEERNCAVLLFEDGEIEIASSLVQGTYPDYRRLLPQGESARVVVEREELLYATKQIRSLTSEAIPSIIFNWKGDKKLNVKSVDSVTGKYENNLAAKIKQTAKEAETTIALNVQYLQEALQAIDAPQLEMTFYARLKPCFLRGMRSNKPDGSYRHAIMPLNVSAD